MSVTGTGASTQAPQTANGVGAETPTTAFLWPNRPNIIDFWFWLQTNVSIPEAALPASSPYPQYALWQALDLVLNDTGYGPRGKWQQWGDPNYPSNHYGISYTLAVYNCATALLFDIAPDQAGQNFFTAKRAEFSLVQPSTGLVSAASDVTTSSTLASPDWAKKLTIDQLNFMRTPWGRSYLQYNQKMGPSVWGLT